MSDQLYISHTRKWIEKVVMGLNLCPFAHAPFNEGRISFRLSLAKDEEQLYKDLLQAIDAFLEAGAEQEATGLLIFPNVLGDFERYNDFLEVVDDIIATAGLEKQLQVASFHPQYLFADEPFDDPAHFTNRSPYPMFHFIRQDLLAEALQGYPDPEDIPQQNITRLRDMGWDDMAKRLRDL